MNFKEMTFSTYHETIVWALRGAVERYNDYWEDLLWKEWQDDELQTPGVEQYRLPLVIFSRTLLESVINFYLCTKCDAKTFSTLERKSLLKKWTEIPKDFVPQYSVPSDAVADLESLIRRRNQIIHSKPHMSIDGDNRHAGNEPSATVNEHQFMGSCAKLPFRLVENIWHRDAYSFMALSNLRIWCGTVANEFETGLRRQENLSSFPRELIKELMRQGFDRRSAVLYAACLGEDPKLDECGCYVIYPGKKIQIKPLAYFEQKRTGARDNK